MKYEKLVKPSVLSQPVYEPGKPIEVVAREFGLDPDGIAKLASNENPFGPSPQAIDAMRSAAEEMHLYPENSCWFLRHALAEREDMEPDQFAMGNGCNQIIELLGHLFIGPGVEVVMGKGAFISYKIFTLLFGGTPVEVELKDYAHDLDAMLEAVTDKTRLVFLPCPNNPTGTVNPSADIIAFARQLPEHVVFCLDQAYFEYFNDNADLRPLIREGRKVVSLRTFSKIYGLAGLRIGYGICDAALARLLATVRPPFSVNAMAQAAALAALDDRGWVDKVRTQNRLGLDQLEAEFKAFGMEYVPSQGNFVLVRFADAPAAFRILQENGVITRPVAGYGFPDHLRISVGTEHQNQRLLEVIKSKIISS